MSEDAPTYTAAPGNPASFLADDAAISAFEETFEADSRDPAVAAELKIWMQGWKAAIIHASAAASAGLPNHPYLVAARQLSEVYFTIASSALGENEVRRQRDLLVRSQSAATASPRAGDECRNRS